MTMTTLYVLAILGIWLVAASLFVGVGLLVARATGFRDGPLPLLFWLGWATTIVLLQLLHFFRPIDSIVHHAPRADSPRGVRSPNPGVSDC